MLLSVNCEPCHTTELLPQPITTTTTTSTELQALTLASLPPLPDPSCGFRPEEATYHDTLVPEQPLSMDQAFMASQMSDISISMASRVQNTPGSEVVNTMIERYDNLLCVHVHNESAQCCFRNMWRFEYM